MILKKENKELSVLIQKGENHSGLGDEDVWCKFDVKVTGNQFSFHFFEDAISWNELLELVCILEQSMNSDTNIKKRISFIKNYFVFYLNCGRRKKTLKIKFVHINDTDDNLILELVNEEINEFIQLLKGELKKTS